MAVWEEAALHYAADPAAADCLVLEGIRCNDREARIRASAGMTRRTSEADLERCDA